MESVRCSDWGVFFLRGCLWRWIPSCWAWDCSLDPSCLWGEAGNRSISGPPSPGRRRGRSALRLRPGGGWTWWWCGLTETQNDQRDSIHACWILVCVWMNEVWFWLLLDLSLSNPPDSQDAGTSASSNYIIILKPSRLSCVARVHAITHLEFNNQSLVIGTAYRTK